MISILGNPVSWVTLALAALKTYRAVAEYLRAGK